MTDLTAVERGATRSLVNSWKTKQQQQSTRQANYRFMKQQWRRQKCKLRGFPFLLFFSLLFSPPLLYLALTFHIHSRFIFRFRFFY